MAETTQNEPGTKYLAGRGLVSGEQGEVAARAAEEADIGATMS